MLHTVVCREEAPRDAALRSHSESGVSHSIVDWYAVSRRPRRYHLRDVSCERVREAESAALRSRSRESPRRADLEPRRADHGSRLHLSGPNSQENVRKLIYGITAHALTESKLTPHSRLGVNCRALRLPYRGSCGGRRPQASGLGPCQPQASAPGRPRASVRPYRRSCSRAHPSSG